MALNTNGLFDVNFDPYEIEDGKIILCGVPGAFTPGCTEKHLPGFVDNLDELTDLGIDKVIFMSVTDGCVMEAWNRYHGDSAIQVLADPLAKFTKRIGMEHDYGETMGVRCRRFALLIENGEIVKEFKSPYAHGVMAEL